MARLHTTVAIVWLIFTLIFFGMAFFLGVFQHKTHLMFRLPPGRILRL